jgi:hypothetical protein
MIQAFYGIVGALGVLCLMLAVTGMIVDRFGVRMAERSRARDAQAAELATRRIGVEISKSAYWFSECREAQALMLTLGAELGELGAIGNLEDLRDRWRKLALEIKPPRST